MNILQSIILGIIEGLTEFLPISSTGHMIIASSVMGIASLPFVKMFTVCIQLGAILSVVFLYWKRFLGKIDLDFYKKLIIAFIPAAIFGVLFKKHIEAMLENVVVVAVALLAGGIIFLLLDNWFRKTEENGEPELKSDKKAFIIGLFQVIAAMFPGVSRSAATIIGGLTQKLNKKAAAEFSFFLAVPTMLAATVKELWDFYKAGNGFHGDEIRLLIIGNIVAFIIAMLSIRFFINYLTKHGFRIFGYYRIALGSIVLILYLLGYNLTML
ncbi:MAG TPA: undecaprenyl-diphosphate phosphatase [Bacteroidia bacterium]|jgi:undecaprenyl-diphosphatase